MMNYSELQLIKDKEVNDNNWSCMVVLLIESKANYTKGIDLFEKYVRSNKRAEVHNLTPEDLEPLFPKKKPISITKEPPQQETIKSESKNENGESNISEKSQSILQALVLKQYILDYKVNDLAKRAGMIRYLLTNEIIVTESDTSIPEPEYGAFCYFVLTKFYDPSLINNLIDLGVPLVAVFEFKIEIDVVIRKSAPYDEPRTELINNYWDKFIEQLNNPENNDYFSEYLFLPIEISYEQWNDKKKGDIVFEHILLKLLSLNNLMRKYIHYINNVEIIDAPMILKKGNWSTYKKLVDSVPLECTTVELILHCIIEQVVAHLEGAHNIPHINNLEYVFEPKEIKFPLLFINHRDNIRRMTFNLKTNDRLNIDVISSNMHSLMSYSTIWNNYPPQTEVEKVLNTNHVKKLLRCASEDITEDKFLLLLHLISFNKLMCTATNSQSLEITKSTYDRQLLSFKTILDKEERNKIVKACKSNIKLNTTNLPKRHVHLNALKNFLECKELDSLLSYNFPNDMLDFCYLEDLPKETILQSLNKANSNFLHNDFYYCPLTDKLLLWFHNYCDENGLYSRIQEGLLHAMIGFGDFFTYPDYETIEWLSNQQRQMTLVDEAKKKSYISRNFSDINPLTFVLNPSVKVKIPFPKKEYMSKKSKKVPFAKAYNSFGSCRLKVSEHTDTFISVDGPSLTVKRTKWLRKDGCITIILNSHQHLLTLHQSLLNLNTPTVYDINQEMIFNIQSNKGIIVSTRMRTKAEIDLILESGKENKAHYETLITLPNGLLIELFRGKYNFIKQKFLIKNHLEDDDLTKEDYRIFLNNGTVIVFMNDGSILLLYCNSTEARIKVVGKKPPKFQNNETEESKKDVSTSEDTKEMPYEIIRHEIVGWNGRFLRFNRDDLILSKQLHQLKAAFCSTKGLFTARSDGTKCYVDHEGISTTSFPDKTITTVIPIVETASLDSIESIIPSSVEVEEGEDEEPFEIIRNTYIMDHPYYMKVEYDSENWIVHLPFEGKIIATTNGFQIAYDKYTDFSFNDGTVSVVSKSWLAENKITLTNIFLKEYVPFEYTICSVKSSDGKIFYVSNTGGTTLQRIVASEKEESSKTQSEQTLPKKMTKSQRSISKRSSIRISLSPSRKKEQIPYATKHFQNQILLYTETDLSIEKNSNLSYATIKSVNELSNTKENHRFFVLRRDLSGYELINEFDIKSMLKKYETNFKVFQPFLPCTTVTNDITVCQMPLSKTWSQLFWTPCSSSRLYKTNFKKNELLDIPTNRKWLCSSTIRIPSQAIGFTQGNKPTIDTIGLKYPAMLIRRIRNIRTKFNFFKMFKAAKKQFEILNCEIMYKYEKQLVPSKKLQSDIDKSEMIFKNAMDVLIQGTEEVPFTEVLAKGDSISTEVSSTNTVDVIQSEESTDEETDSQKNFA